MYNSSLLLPGIVNESAQPADNLSASENLSTTDNLPENDPIPETMSLPSDKEKKKKKNPPLVESQVRSPQLKEVNKGFKADCCASKKCWACNSNPPKLSQAMIKKLGHDLCQIDEDLLSEEALKQKKKKYASRKIMKENFNPNKAFSDDQDAEETLCQIKKRIKKTNSKKDVKKSKKIEGNKYELQDEDAAYSEDLEDGAPKKEMKK